MSRQGGVLEMTEGREYLTFPGPGGYKIEWSPGTKRHKLDRADTGHLILPCDGFEKVKANAGIDSKTKVFVAKEEPDKEEPKPPSLWAETPATKKVKINELDWI
jgi:hypothetical protein